ncbi:hypothetical protein KC19_8G097800 [Ceratodon purpureus]|uniref:Transmembrane protein 135 N-terminal domain-containing protein n=1 Tax=Ceratodon purpureus TaxID=3225 RepID=A0A8T0H0M0_CERPU|nr:hypothetical protein KC19_8G097800 [Ceratodon purpureus]
MDGDVRSEESALIVEEVVREEQDKRNGTNGIVPLLADKMVNSKDLGRNGLLSAPVLVNGRMIQSRSVGALARLASGVEKISIFETIGGPPKDECSTSGQDDGKNTWRAIERCVAASVKGFIIGSGLRGGLSLFGILMRLMKTSRASKKGLKVEKTNKQAILVALRDTLRYGLFLGTFAGGFCTVEETIAALGGSRRTARWRALVAGAVVGPSLLLTGHKERHTSMAIYILLRAAVLAARCGLKSESAGWLFKPLSWRHGDTFLMCLSSCQILSAWILKPSSLPKPYVSFLNKQGAKDPSILKGISQLAFNTKPFTALKGIEEHYRSTGVDLKLDPEMTIPCTMIHGKQGCAPHFFSFWVQAYLRALPVYLPVYLVPALLVHRQGLFARPSPILWKSVLGIARSSLFLSMYTSTSWAWTCFLFRSTGICNPPLVATATFPAGLTVMIEKKSRRMELALYCFARAIESFAICVADWGVLERYNLIPPKRIDVFLFSAATAIIMHCYAQERDVFRSKYLNVLDWVFGLPDGATKYNSNLPSSRASSNAEVLLPKVKSSLELPEPQAAKARGGIGSGV